MLRSIAALCVALVACPAAASPAAPPESGHEEKHIDGHNRADRGPDRRRRHNVRSARWRRRRCGHRSARPSSKAIPTQRDRRGQCEWAHRRAHAQSRRSRCTRAIRSRSSRAGRSPRCGAMSSAPNAASNSLATTRDRDEALYAKGFRPLREVEISRAAYAEADVALRAGAPAGLRHRRRRGGGLNRIVITAPIVWARDRPQRHSGPGLQRRRRRHRAVSHRQSRPAQRGALGLRRKTRPGSRPLTRST